MWIRALRRGSQLVPVVQPAETWQRDDLGFSFSTLCYGSRRRSYLLMTLRKQATAQDAGPTGDPEAAAR